MERAIDVLRRLDPESALALDAVATERLRQIEVEGWEVAHDDAHDKGELAAAASCYAANACLAVCEPNSAYSGEPPPAWPWDRRWWKPRKPYRDLTRAAALSVAEMARRMRKACDIAEDAIGSATAPADGDKA